jgi:hypothetical protein
MATPKQAQQACNEATYSNSSKVCFAKLPSRILNINYMNLHPLQLSQNWMKSLDFWFSRQLEV